MNIQTRHEQVAQDDRRLSAEVERAEDSARLATLKRDALRFAWTTDGCPDDLRLTLTAYAELVGVSKAAITRSVQSVQRSLDDGVVRTDNIPFPDAPAPVEPTKDDADRHQSSRNQAQHSDSVQIIAAAIADAFDIAESSAAKNANWKPLRDSIVAAADESGKKVTKTLARKMVAEFKAERDERKRLRDLAESVMKQNRTGLDAKVTAKMIDDIVARAHRQAERQGDLSVEEALRSLLDFDRKQTDEERRDAERAAARSSIVSDIEVGLSMMVRGGEQAHTAMLRAQGELDLDETEVSDFGMLVERARGLLGVIDLLITGKANWDDALRELTEATS